MSGHRVEVMVHFLVGDECGQLEAEAVVRRIERIGASITDFTVIPLTVDGNDWHEKWPPKEPARVVCPTSCDPDCDADCHEEHEVSYKRLHKPQDCPGRSGNQR